MNLTPEQRARLDIDAALEAAGWTLQNRDALNLAAGPGVAMREARMASGHGFPDYLPFVYMSTGVETRFINGLDPDPRTRAISANLPEPHLLAQEIADDLRSALAQIEDVLGDLEQRVGSAELEEV